MTEDSVTAFRAQPRYHATGFMYLRKAAVAESMKRPEEAANMRRKASSSFRVAARLSKLANIWKPKHN